MNKTERKQIKSQLIKCAVENENKVTFTGFVIVSEVCRAAVKRIRELEKENKECAEVWGNLTKAKELLAKWVELFKPKGGNIPPTPIQVETEQFLKEIEK